MPLNLFAEDTCLTGGRGSPNAVSPGSDGNDWTQESGIQTLAFTSDQIVVSWVNLTDAFVLTYADMTEGDQDASVNGLQTITDPQSIGIALRYVDTDNYYFAHIVSDDILIEKNVGGTITSLGLVSKSLPFGTKFGIRFQCVGSTLKAKAWDAGTSEPGAWDISLVDTSLSAGKFGIFSSPIGTGDVKFDTFSATNGSGPDTDPMPTGSGIFIPNLSAGVLNGLLVSGIDISEYKQWSLQIDTIASGGTITFQGSNDGIRYVDVMATNATTGTAATTTTSTGIFYAKRVYRYIQAVQTAWSSGTTTGTLVLHTQAA